MQNEVAERRKVERQLNLEYAVSRILAESGTFGESAQKTLRVIGEAYRHENGALWMLDHRAGVLECAEIWSVAGPSMDAFLWATRTSSFVKGAGLPGRVWATGQPTFIPEVREDPNFPRATTAAHVGLRGGFAFPILTGNGIGGVMEFFSRETRR